MLLDRLTGRRRAQVAARILEDAREYAETAGPWQIAADYGAMPDASLPEIAATFAKQAYRDEPGVQILAKVGAQEGFDRYLAAHPHEPYD